jgi:hypothetical protein
MEGPQVSCAVIVPALTYPGQDSPALTFTEITRLYVRHKLAWVLLPIMVYQIVSVILMYDHVTFGRGWMLDNVIWWCSALPRLLQRFRRIITYLDAFAVSNPYKSLFSPALVACCAWALLLSANLDAFAVSNPFKFLFSLALVACCAWAMLFSADLGAQTIT